MTWLPYSNNIRIKVKQPIYDDIKVVLSMQPQSLSEISCIYYDSSETKCEVKCDWQQIFNSALNTEKKLIELVL